MFRLRTLLWRRTPSMPQLVSSTPCPHSIDPLLVASIAWECQTISAQQQEQQQQSYSSNSCTTEEAEHSGRQPRRTAKIAAARDHGWPEEKSEGGPRKTLPNLETMIDARAPPGLPKSEGPSAAWPSRWVYVPVDKLTAKDTCEGVWDMLSKTLPQNIHVISLSAALDHMVAISKRPGYQQSQEGLSAVKQLLNIAEARLGSLNSWTMAAFIRCAAGFKGWLQPAGLSAWQQELLQRPRLVEQLTKQGVANTLLSLGTLTESDVQLARVLDLQLARQLLQHAVRFARAANDNAALSARHTANMVHGAALLGLQPDAAQVAALFSAIQRGVWGLERKGVAQVLLASQKFMDRADRQRQEQGLGPLRPELNPYTIYYPGNKLMGLLLERACQLVQRQQLDLQGASQILGACGFLGYLPSDLALQRLLTVLGTGELTTAETSATVMGCARLGIIPPVEVIVACWRALMRGGGEDTQATANVAWALALLDACTPRMWEILTSRLLANLDGSTGSPSPVAPGVPAHQAAAISGSGLPARAADPQLGCPPSRAGEEDASYTL